jgi:hypothetical protein
MYTRFAAHGSSFHTRQGRTRVLPRNVINVHVLAVKNLYRLAGVVVVDGLTVAVGLVLEGRLVPYPCEAEAGEQVILDNVFHDFIERDFVNRVADSTFQHGHGLLNYRVAAVAVLLRNLHLGRLRVQGRTHGFRGRVQNVVPVLQGRLLRVRLFDAVAVDYPVAARVEVVV